MIRSTFHELGERRRWGRGASVAATAATPAPATVMGSASVAPAATASVPAGYDRLYDQIMGAMRIDSRHRHSGMLHVWECSGIMVDRGDQIVCGEYDRPRKYHVPCRPVCLPACLPTCHSLCRQHATVTILCYAQVLRQLPTKQPKMYGPEGVADNNRHHDAAEQRRARCVPVPRQRRHSPHWDYRRRNV